MAVATTDLGAVSIIPKGTYSSSVTYERLSVVYYEGNSYIAKQNSKGVPVTNTSYWQKLCEKGYTPIRGTDYWTNQDKQQILNEIDADIQNYINEPFINFSIENGNLMMEVNEWQK